MTPAASTDPDEPGHPDGPSGQALGHTTRSSLRRKKERGSYDRALAESILDEGLVCHVGFVVDESPFVMPMTYARVGDALYLHGATGNRMLRHISGAELCVTVTLLDAIVLARSALHHSMNYRSVVLFGTAEVVTDEDEKRRATESLLEHMAVGRSTDTRSPTFEELRSTLFVRLHIEEGSVKVRTGGPIDDPEDMTLAVWAGLIPMTTVAGEGVADDPLPPGTREPRYVRAYPSRTAKRAQVDQQ